MAMVLSEEAGMLKDAAKGFLADSAPVSQLRKLRDEESADGFDRSTWKAMAERVIGVEIWWPLPRPSPALALPARGRGYRRS